jgi:hypothetical protein
MSGASSSVIMPKMELCKDLRVYIVDVIIILCLEYINDKLQCGLLGTAGGMATVSAHHNIIKKSKHKAEFKFEES